MLSNKTVSRLIMSGVSLFIMGFMVIYFILSSSYQDALTAKFYYFMGDFKEASNFAEKALEQDRYNKLASTILSQSKTSLKFLEYSNEANKYLIEIGVIARGDEITKADRIRVKMICEIMIERYKKLSSNVFTDKELAANTKESYEKFLELYEEVGKKK